MKFTLFKLPIFLLTVMILSGCYSPGLVELAWDEEAKLPDDRVIIVKMVHTYYCSSYRLKKFDGVCSPLDTSMKLEAISGRGSISKEFKSFHPLFIGQKNGTWYAILVGSYRFDNRSIIGQDWGDQQSPYSQWAIRLINGEWQPMNFCDFPDEFKSPNLLLPYGKPEDLSQFNSTLLSLEKKANWLSLHPHGVTTFSIARPVANSRYACTQQPKPLTQELSK